MSGVIRPCGECTNCKNNEENLTNLKCLNPQKFMKKRAPIERREQINHPEHYGGDTTYEVIKVIEAWKLDFHLGNAVKYIARAFKKDDALVNLKKAVWYIQRKIDELEKAL